MALESIESKKRVSSDIQNLKDKIAELTAILLRVAHISPISIWIKGVDVKDFIHKVSNGALDSEYLRDSYHLAFEIDGRKTYNEALDELKDLIMRRLNQVTVDAYTLENMHATIGDFLSRMLIINYAVARGVLGSGVNLSPGLRSKLEEVASHAERAYSELFGGQIQLNDEETKMAHSIAEIMKRMMKVIEEPTIMSYIERFNLRKYRYSIDDHACTFWIPPSLSEPLETICDLHELTNATWISVDIDCSGGECVAVNIKGRLVFPDHYLQSPPRLDKIIYLLDNMIPSKTQTSVIDDIIKYMKMLRMLTTINMAGEITIDNKPLISWITNNQVVLEWSRGSFKYMVIARRDSFIVARSSADRNQGFWIEVDTYGYMVEPATRDIPLGSLLARVDADELKVIRDKLKQATLELLRFYYSFYMGVLSSNSRLAPSYQTKLLAGLGLIDRMYASLLNKDIELTKRDKYVLESVKNLTEKMETVVRKMINSKTELIEGRNYRLMLEKSDFTPNRYIAVLWILDKETMRFRDHLYIYVTLIGDDVHIEDIKVETHDIDVSKVLVRLKRVTENIVKRV